MVSAQYNLFFEQLNPYDDRDQYYFTKPLWPVKTDLISGAENDAEAPSAPGFSSIEHSQPCQTSGGDDADDALHKFPVTSK